MRWRKHGGHWDTHRVQCALSPRVVRERSAVIVQLGHQFDSFDLTAMVGESEYILIFKHEGCVLYMGVTCKCGEK